jgi:hypothetical protein
MHCWTATVHENNRMYIGSEAAMAVTLMSLLHSDCSLCLLLPYLMYSALKMEVVRSTETLADYQIIGYDIPKIVIF